VVRGIRPLSVVLVAVLLGVVGIAVARLAREDGRIGPDRRLLNNGRRLEPHGRLTRIGQFPTGGRLTPDGRFLWTVSSGRGRNDVRIVSVRTGEVVQVVPLPGASGGIVMDRRRPTAYVSGIRDSTRGDQRSAPGTPGIQGDVVHVFGYDRSTGKAQRAGILEVPAPADAPEPQAFGAGPGRYAWPDRLALSPDGRTLLVPLNLAARAAIVDIASRRVRYVETGSFPYGAAILPGGKRGLVSNEVPGTVSVIDLAAGRKLRDIRVGPHLSHPEAIALDPRASRAYVAVTNSDQVAVIDTRRLRVERTLSVERPQGIGAAPVDLAVMPDGRRLVVANEGTDEIVVIRLPRSGAARSAGSPRTIVAADRRRMRATRRSADWQVAGRIPTAQMPTAVDVVRARGRTVLAWVSGKGLGTGPNPRGPNPNSPDDTDDRINRVQYLPLLNRGLAGVATFPTGARLAALTRTALRQVVPTNAVRRPPSGTPVRKGGPIRHIFYIVRENRTYDQVLGDDRRGDGDPRLTLFGRDVTPNAHALVRRFPLLDHVYANSEASIDGHFWTAAAKVSDYVHKAWFQNYAGRGRPYDFGVYAVSWPANGFLFDQAERQNVSWFNYGEAVAGVVPFNDRDRTPAENAAVARKFAKTDLGASLEGGVADACFANVASVGTDILTGKILFDSVPPPGAPAENSSRTACFQRRFFEQLATDRVPAFNYLTLTNDHTEGLRAGERTPRAMVADNDEALGRVVDLISHSRIWRSSAIFVVEDDSQDGADHVDAHRIPAMVISPWARRGAVVHTRYDFLSFIRTMELILGLRPLGLFDELATPMYDAFTGKPDLAPYTFIPARVPLLETNPSGTPGARASARVPRCLDCASQRELDALLWKSVHGQDAVPPPPGPNASGLDDERGVEEEDRLEEAREEMVRALKRQLRR
jgi:DNA-binding beta-propeller fold protein YncE